MNELLWLGLLLINFSCVLLFYKIFGKTGLYIWIAISTIICNIQVLETVKLFGLVATLGNILYGTTFLATDILSENYGKKEARKGVLVGLLTIIITTFIMNLSLQFIPHSSDFAHDSLTTIFGIMPRIALASLVAYIISQYHDTWAYDFWKKKTGKIYVANNFSTMISQLIDSVIFSVIAFYGLFSLDIFMQILLTTYLFKWLVAVSDTPFVYLSKKIKNSAIIKNLCEEEIS